MRQTLAPGVAIAAGFSAGFVIEVGDAVVAVAATLLAASIAGGALYDFTVTGPRMSFIGYLATSAKFGSITGSALILGLAVPQLIELGGRTWDAEWQDVAFGVLFWGFAGAIVGVSMGVALLALMKPGAFLRSRTPGGPEATT